MSFSFGRGSEVFVHRRWFFSDWCSLGSRCRMSRAAHIQVAMSWMHRSTIFFSNIRRDCNLRIGELKQPRNCLLVIDLLLLSEALALSPKRVFFLAHGHIEEGLEHSTVSIFLFFFQSQSAHLDSLLLAFSTSVCFVCSSVREGLCQVHAARRSCSWITMRRIYCFVCQHEASTSFFSSAVERGIAAMQSS
jgi:hypothetical protein